MSGAAVRPEEAAAARSVRAAVGHALRDARHRRQHDDDRFGFHYPPVISPSRPLLLRPSRFWIQVLSGIGLILLFLVIFWYPGVPGGMSPPAPDAPSSPAPTAIAGGGRGRTTATLPPVVIVRPTAQATPATPAPVPPATGVPGSGTGTGTGIFGPPPLKPTDDRFIFTVRDAQTFQVLKGVCVTYGQSDCGRLTDASGRWWVDFPRGGDIAKPFDFLFQMPGYVPHHEPVEYTPGFHEIDVLLTKSS